MPATILANANPAFTGGVNFGPTNITVNGTLYPALIGTTSGCDVSVHHLDSVSIPGIVGYGTNDEAVGWQATASLPGVQPINSNVDAMLTNATAASSLVTRYSTNSFHELTSAQATYYSGTWFPNVVDPLCPKTY